jgi:hypothetical protein
VADTIAYVQRTLNTVQSAGEARAAITSAEKYLDYGQGLVGSLSRFASPTPDEAQDTINLHRAALDAELRGFAAQADDSPVDPQPWARAQREIIRACVDVAGIEGTALGSIAASEDLPGNLADSIANAPKVFGQGVGSAIKGVGEVAGNAGAGLLSGLGVIGVLVLVVVVVLVARRTL